MSAERSDESLVAIKGHWNQILDRVLEKNRIAWLAYFDARIAGLENDTLLLSFADSEKFGGDHNFTIARNPIHEELLIQAIKDEVNLDVAIGEQ